MSSAVTTPQSLLLERLLKTGRWNNKSEVVRAGIELLAREVAREDLSPLSDAELARCYEEMSAAEKAEDNKLARRSARHKPGAVL
jgi:Arc/MetJ-type ribon-helix-helix transcriptional regulator